MHYQATIIIEKETPKGVTPVLRTASQFYAIPIDRMLELMRHAGFQDCRRMDETIYQPILAGKESANWRLRRMLIDAPPRLRVQRFFINSDCSGLLPYARLYLPKTVAPPSTQRFFRLT